jgi:hypothetical protein
MISEAAIEERGFGEEFAPGVKEFTIQDMMLGLLRLAKAGLRRNSVDELERLIEYCIQIPREQWPPEVARFVDRRMLPRNKMRAKVSRLVDWFKRPPFRMRSRRADLGRFYSSQNHIAAHLASLYIAKWRRSPGKSKRQGPYKVQLADGRKITTHDAAVRRAVDEVNSSLRHAGSSQQARVDTVKELVRRGRTRRPATRL